MIRRRPEAVQQQHHEHSKTAKAKTVPTRWPEVGIRFCLDPMPQHADRSDEVEPYSLPNPLPSLSQK